MPSFLRSLFSRRQKDPTESELAVLPHGPPLSLDFETGCFPAFRGLRYKVAGGVVTRVNARYGMASACHRKPAPEEWDRFWVTAERLGLRHWRSNYEVRRSGEFKFDGNGWRLKLRALQFKINSGGRGCCPAVAAPHSATRSPEALTLLQEALDRLVDRPPMPKDL